MRTLFDALTLRASRAAMICVTAMMLAAGPVNAGSLDAPQGRVILELRGKISNTNGEGVALFDRRMLESLPQETVTTVTPWTDGQSMFTGPLARDLMKLVGAVGKQVEAVALNDYGVVIPTSDFEDYRVILAMLMDGKTMVHGRSIWQLKAMNVRE
jgi:hypothetical protein